MVALALPALAQPTPDPMFQDFEPVGEFALQIDGTTDPKAEIYKSERARAILVISSQLDQPVMFNLRSRQVERVGFMSLAKRDDGTYDILADADITPVTVFSVSEQGASANMNGKTIALAARESLTGPHKASELTAYDPAYARGAAAYTPNEQLLASLRRRRRTSASRCSSTPSATSASRWCRGSSSSTACSTTPWSTSTTTAYRTPSRTR